MYKYRETDKIRIKRDLISHLKQGKIPLYILIMQYISQFVCQYLLYNKSL